MSFFDRDGNLIINEAEGGRTFNSIEVDGVRDTNCVRYGNQQMTLKVFTAWDNIRLMR